MLHINSVMNLSKVIPLCMNLYNPLLCVCVYIYIYTIKYSVVNAEIHLYAYDGGWNSVCNFLFSLKCLKTVAVWWCK
jgi:hypothetical protein